MLTDHQQGKRKMCVISSGWTVSHTVLCHYVDFDSTDSERMCVGACVAVTISYQSTKSEPMDTVTWTPYFSLWSFTAPFQEGPHNLYLCQANQVFGGIFLHIAVKVKLVPYKPPAQVPHQHTMVILSKSSCVSDMEKEYQWVTTLYTLF